MNKELLGSVVLAAAIGVLVSSLVTLFAQWRERAARQRELIFTAAVDISKSYTERVATLRKNIQVSEVMAVERNYKILTEIFKHGEMSDENRAYLSALLDDDEEAVGEDSGQKLSSDKKEPQPEG
jgi:hypothetical protein